MKNLLFILGTLIFFAISCEEIEEFSVSAKDGKDGTNGENGYSAVVKIDTVYDSNGRRGIQTSYYWDSDNVSGYSAGDLPQNTGYTLWDGVDGKTVMATFSIVESDCPSGYSLIFTSSLDGKTISTVSICVPANGLTPSLKTTETFLGVIYLWYFDMNSNKVYDEGDMKISENLIINGQNGSPASAFPCFTKSYNMQGANANYFTSTDFVLKGFVYSESDGALYLHESCGSILFPSVVENKGLLLLTFNYGSRNPYDLVVKAIYRDDTEEVIKNVHLEGNPSFDKNLYSTYSLFEYRAADFNNLQFKNVKRIKIEAVASGKCIPEDLFIDNVDEVFGL